MRISGTTRVFCILGDPVAQVRAPQVYNHLFEQHGMTAENLGGFWATIPHTPALAKLLDPTDPVDKVRGR